MGRVKRRLVMAKADSISCDDVYPFMDEVREHKPTIGCNPNPFGMYNQATPDKRQGLMPHLRPVDVQP